MFLTLLYLEMNSISSQDKMPPFMPSENGIGRDRRIATIFLRWAEESGWAEEDSSEHLRTADDIDLPHVKNKYVSPILENIYSRFQKGWHYRHVVRI